MVKMIYISFQNYFQGCKIEIELIEIGSEKRSVKYKYTWDFVQDT